MKKSTTLLLLVFYLSSTLGYCLLESGHQFMHLFPQFFDHVELAHGDDHQDDHHQASDHYEVLKIIGEPSTDQQDRAALAVLFSCFTFITPEVGFQLLPKIEQLVTLTPSTGPMLQTRALAPPYLPPQASFS